MRLADLKSTILSLRPQDWEQVRVGPFYAESHAQVTGPDGTWIEVEEHHVLAVHREDVRLGLMFGIERGSDLDFGWHFPDPHVRRNLVDAFWDGALVHRWHVYDVDGHRAYLPETHGLGPSTPVADWKAVEGFRMWATPEDTDIARLVNGIEGKSTDLDDYMRRAEIAVLDLSPPD